MDYSGSLFTVLGHELAKFDPTIPGLSQLSAALAQNIFINLQKTFNTAISLEIGAHEASYSRLLRQAMPDIKIVAFEGSPLNYKYFTDIIDFDSLDIEYKNIIISTESGLVRFYDHAQNEGDTINPSGISSIIDRCDMPDSKKEPIMMTSLSGDEYIENLEADNIGLWIDVEGAQNKVLLSLQRSLKQKKINSIYIEVETISYWKEQWLIEDVLNYLGKFGFIPLLREHTASNQFNVVFIRRDLMSEDILEAAKRYLQALEEHVAAYKKRKECIAFLNVYLGDEVAICRQRFLVSYIDDRIVLVPAEGNRDLKYTFLLHDNNALVALHIEEDQVGITQALLQSRAILETAIRDELGIQALQTGEVVFDGKKGLCCFAKFSHLASPLYVDLIRSFVTHSLCRLGNMRGPW